MLVLTIQTNFFFLRMCALFSRCIASEFFFSVETASSMCGARAFWSDPNVVFYWCVGGFGLYGF